MAQKEYFVRQPETEDADGPYPIETLVSLGDVGKVKLETLYYDDVTEQWTAIAENEELRKQVFPEKRKLGLKARTPDAAPESLAAADKARPSVSVHQLLAAAEAETDETRYLKEQKKEQDRATSIGLQLLTLLFFLSAAALIYPSWSLFQPVISGDEDFAWSMLLVSPLPIIGAVDLFAGLLLALAMTELYPLLRIRAMLGMGYFGYLGYAGWAAGDIYGLGSAVAAILFGLGVLGLTLSYRMYWIVICGLAGIIGVVGYAAAMLYPALV